MPVPIPAVLTIKQKTLHTQGNFRYMVSAFLALLVR